MKHARKAFLAHRIGTSYILSWDRKSFLAHRIRISEILPWDRIIESVMSVRVR